MKGPRAMNESENIDQEAAMEIPKPLSQNSTLTISLAIALVGGVISFTWFIARLQSDVRTMQVDLAGIKSTVIELSKVNGLATEIRELKQYGSDVARKASLDIIDLKREFELHKVQTSK